MLCNQYKMTMPPPKCITKIITFNNRSRRRRTCLRSECFPDCFRRFSWDNDR